MFEVVPEMAELLNEAKANPDLLAQGQINVIRHRTARNLFVRISSEQLDGEIDGFVVTIDDITQLVDAERMAAWADVARRIAHEIRNPLTPIQLAAERLKRKYGDEVVSDPAIFEECTDTIVRQVGDIRRMVDEFSDFARMPEPTFANENLNELVRQSMFLLEVSSPEVHFSAYASQDAVMLRCDGRLIAQALTNVIKNAVESTERRERDDGNALSAGEVSVTFLIDEREVRIVVEDNGQGLPKERSDRLTEPYVTTRTKGTGLGLAIVKKIMKDHGGDVILEDREKEGARVSLVFAQGLIRNEGGSKQIEDALLAAPFK